jgi:hypothetical protein
MPLARTGVFSNQHGEASVAWWCQVPTVFIKIKLPQEISVYVALGNRYLKPRISEVLLWEIDI